MIGILILGCLMEGTAILVMTTPVLLPVLAHAGIDPLHFGVLLAVNIMIGNITPPVGMILYVVSEVGKVSVVEVSKEVWPFVVALLVALFIAAFFPLVVTFVPDLLLPLK
jgi:TRAP-type C4-dicarboxylate transport system permease large subunit